MRKFFAARMTRATSILWLVSVTNCTNPFGGDCVSLGVMGIQTLVTDATTQRAPATVATVRIRSGDYVETITAPSIPSDPVSYYGAFERPGRYEVQVDAPGYRSETRRSIDVRRVGSCNAVRPVRVQVALTPGP